MRECIRYNMPARQGACDPSDEKKVTYSYTSAKAIPPAWASSSIT